MSKINIGGDIIGNNNHIGDTYYSYEYFLDNHPSLNDKEKDIAKLVFDNEETNEGINKLLKSLAHFSEKRTDNSDNETISLWKKFAVKLKKKGLEKGVDLLLAYFVTNLPELYQVIHHIVK